MAEYAADDELLPDFNRLNEPSFAELARARAGGGFAHLGNVIGSTLAGGGARDLRGQQVFQQAAKSGASTADILLQARQRRDAEIGRQATAKELQDKGDMEGANIVLNSANADQAQKALLQRDQLRGLGNIGGALQGVGYSPQQAQLGSAMFSGAGGINPQNSIEALLRASLGSGAQAPVVPQSSQTLAHALVPASTKVAGGLIYDETAPPSQTMVQTPESRARVSEITQLGGEHVAQAHLADTRADKIKAGGTDDAGNLLPLPGDLKGEDYLQSLPPNRAAVAELLVHGKQAPPSGYGLKSPEVRQALGDAMHADPTYDANRFSVRKEFESGGPNAPASVITAGSTALQHLAQLADKARALDTVGNAGVLNLPANLARTAYLGLKQDPRVAEFNAVRDKFVEEATRFYRGVGGAEADIKREIEGLNAAQSPQQLQGVIQAQAHLLESKVNALQDRWRKTMGIASADFPILGDASTADALTNINAGIRGGKPVYRVGDAVTVHGKRYRVKGGDPGDPELEPLP